MVTLFAAGSTCFLVAPLPAFLQAVGPQVDAVVFLLGSILFTAAASLQWLETIRPSRTDGVRTHAFWQPHRLDWWSSTVQLIGTLFFNATTFHSLTTTVGSPSYDRVVWRPDALGSLCFLVSGVLAYVDLSGSLLHRPPRTIEGLIVSSNLLGSVAFGLAALGAYVLADSNAEVNVTLVNVATAVGALLFLVASLLLVPQQRRQAT